MVRRPAAAGMFYPREPDDLEHQLVELWPGEGIGPQPALAAVSPHAGLIYSGRTAARTLSRVKVPETVIVLCPNHRGLGAPAAIMDRGSWLMPGFEKELDSEVAGALLAETDILEIDHRAHAQEHSLEVQLPFLQRMNPDFKLVPICLSRSDLPACRELGRAMARVIDQRPGQVLMVASSDMTHYESIENARLKDNLAIQRIRDIDPEGLYRVVMEQRITMCGVIPTVAVLFAARELGATGAELINYTTSGEATGDYSQVVGYAGLVIT